MSTDQHYILAIDLGTSGPKVALFTAQGELVGYEFEPTPYYLLPDGGAEQKPEEWWQAICSATRRLLSRGLAAPEEIAALCCTTQWSGTVAIDRDGTPLMNAIIWMDSRGAPYVRRVTGGRLSVEGYRVDKLYTWLRLSGGIPSHVGKDPIAHILYIRYEHPEIYARTYKFLEPKDYLNLRLTGVCAASYDSMTLHWVTDIRDLAHVDYSPVLLRMGTLEREKLPDLKPPLSVLGPLTKQAAEELGLSQDTQVVIGTPDIPSAAVGSGAVRDFEAHLYIGTSSWIACHVPFKKTDVLHNMASLPSAIPGRYLVTNEQETAGACLTFLRDNILYHQDELLSGNGTNDVYKIFDQIAARTPAGSEGLIFTPWLYGERAPIDDRSVRGGFFNLSLGATREHMIRAVLEGVAYNSRWLLGYVEKFAGQPFEALNVVGGGANSDIWCQILADVLGRKIRQVENPILANARGAAYLAAAALGYMTFDEISEKAHIKSTYLPNPEHQKVYDPLFKEFLQIYQRNKPIYAHLNR
jgi:xylulokinase